MGMELRTLRALVAVIRCGSFTEAAAAVFATQSTVSKMVGKLEAELGVQLLDRSGPRVRPTPAGRIVHDQAVAMLQMQDDLLAGIEDLNELRRGQLRLGVPTVGGDALFAPVLAAYRRLYPGVELRLVEHGSTRLQELLRDGEIDLAGILLPLPDEFAWKELRREPVVVLLPPGWECADDEPVRFAELRDQPFIMYETGFALTAMLHEACHKAGFTPRVAVQSTQISLIFRLVEAGLGVAFMPRMVATMHRRAGVRISELTEPRLEWAMTLAWRHDRYVSQAAKAWLALAEDMIHRGEIPAF